MVEPQTTIVQQTLLVVIGIDFGTIEWKTNCVKQNIFKCIINFFLFKCTSGNTTVWRRMTSHYVFVLLCWHFASWWTRLYLSQCFLFSYSLSYDQKGVYVIDAWVRCTRRHQNTYQQWIVTYSCETKLLSVYLVA
jgi:hypothetical protein